MPILLCIKRLREVNSTSFIISNGLHVRRKKSFHFKTNRRKVTQNLFPKQSFPVCFLNYFLFLFFKPIHLLELAEKVSLRYTIFLLASPLESQIILIERTSESHLEFGLTPHSKQSHHQADCAGPSHIPSISTDRDTTTTVESLCHVFITPIAFASPNI